MPTLLEEIEEFREVGKQFVENKMKMMEFKKASGAFGVYAQKGGDKFMIRLRIPCGILTYEALQFAYDKAVKYELDWIHFTTRQTIQLHYLDWDPVCDIMEDGIRHEIYTRGGGGNYPRNVALSPLSGFTRDEAFDPTPFAEMVNAHFMSKIQSYHLPRKFKVAFSNNEEDTANAAAVDLGFIAVKKDGKPYFRVYMGGGLGNNPRKGIPYPKLVEPCEVLYMVEAMTELFKTHGDYENHAKARIRYIADRMGDEAFIQTFDDIYKEVRKKETLAELTAEKVNVEDEYYHYVELHAQNGIMKLNDVKNLLDFLKKTKCADLRIGMDESLYVRKLTKEEETALRELSKDYNLTDCFGKSTCCIGVPVCQIGIAQSRSLFDLVFHYLKDSKVDTKCLPSIHISGCNNSCSRHQIGAIGLSGRKKRIDDEVQEAFEVYIGGKQGEYDTTLGESYGTIATKKLPMFFEELAMLLNDANMDFWDYFKEHEVDIRKLADKYAS